MSTRDVSSKQENFVARYLDGEITPNSGAGHTKKGDILVEDFYIIECKTKMKESEQFTIKKEWLYKLYKEGLAMGRPYAALVFDFGIVGDEYAVIPLQDLRDYIEKIKEERE